MSQWDRFKPVGREQKKESPKNYFLAIFSWGVLGTVAGWVVAWAFYARLSSRRYRFDDMPMGGDQSTGELFTTTGAVVGLLIGVGVGAFHFWNAYKASQAADEDEV